jgi:hypothetical protein
VIKNRIAIRPFYVVKQENGNLFFKTLSLYDKSEEEVSSAGEQLASNKIYDSEKTKEDLSLREVFFFMFIHCLHGSKKLNLKILHTFNEQKSIKTTFYQQNLKSFPGCITSFIFL